MVAAMGFGAAASAANAYTQSQALGAQADVEKQLGEINTRLADEAVADALYRGEKEAQRMRREARRIIGAQRAAYAGQGVDINSDTPADVQEDTAVIGARDAMTAKNNAWREAWGYRVAALEATSRAQYADISARAASRSTLVTGGLEAVTYGLKAGYYAKGGR